MSPFCEKAKTLNVFEIGFIFQMLSKIDELHSGIVWNYFKIGTVALLEWKFVFWIEMLLPHDDLSVGPPPIRKWLNDYKQAFKKHLSVVDQLSAAWNKYELKSVAEALVLEKERVSAVEHMNRIYHDHIN
mgnify:CR=1 FL=1